MCMALPCSDYYADSAVCRLIGRIQSHSQLIHVTAILDRLPWFLYWHSNVPV